MFWRIDQYWTVHKALAYRYRESTNSGSTTVRSNLEICRCLNMKSPLAFAVPLTKQEQDIGYNLQQRHWLSVCSTKFMIRAKLIMIQWWSPPLTTVDLPRWGASILLLIFFLHNIVLLSTYFWYFPWLLCYEFSWAEIEAQTQAYPCANT